MGRGQESDREGEVVSWEAGLWELDGAGMQPGQ